MDYAFVGYPLTNDFRGLFEKTVGTNPTYLWLAELRRLPPLKLAMMLASLKADRLFIPLEDENSKAFIPVSFCLAAVARAREIVLVQPDLKCDRISRWRTFLSLGSTTGATVGGKYRLWRCRRELGALASRDRIRVRPPAPGPVLYLKTNSSIGVKAGGSVGHIAGVINGLVEMNHPVEFASTEAPLMVGGGVKHLPVRPLDSYGMPYEVNLYRFQDTYVRQVRRLTRDRPYSFLYQRMSLGNYAGVILSREVNIPLVLEYNGSEVWVASRWTVPLRYEQLALRAEEVCLKHAHVVVTVSEVLREELVQRGVEPQRIVAYPNCIHPKTFDPSRFSPEELSALRARLGIPADAVIAAFIGTFGQWHGINVLAEAIRDMVLEDADRLRRSRVHFLIVGDGLLMPAVRATLADERCKPFYTLTGLVPQAEAPAYMATADILLSPHVANPDGSRFFGSPTKLFEYMAMGKAIMASDLEQIGQVLQNSLRAGQLPDGPPRGDETYLSLLGRPGELKELIRGIHFLLEHPEWRALVGRNARAEVLARYTWDRHVDAILAGLKAV